MLKTKHRGKSKYELKQPAWKNSRSPFYGIKFSRRNVTLSNGHVVLMKVRGGSDDEE